MFPTISYLDWLRGRPEAALHDLGASDLRGSRELNAAAVPDILQGLDDPPAGATLETQLASLYGVEPEQVLVTAGATHADLLAAVAAFDAGSAPDEEAAGTTGEGGGAAGEGTGGPGAGCRALVEKPAYEPLVATPRFLGATVDRFLRGDGGALDVGRIRDAAGPGTDLVTVTNRHNPSGALADPDSLLDARDAAGDADARLLVDEVFAPYVGSGDAGETPFGGPSVAGADGVAVTNSLTEFYGLRDVCVGWLVADADVVERARRAKRHLPAVAGTSRALARRALHNGDRLAARARDILDRNSEMLAAFVEERPALSGRVHSGATYAFLAHDAVDGDALTEAAWDEGVLVVPGRFFDDPGRVRVSLGRAPADAEAALDALGTVLDRLAADTQV